MPSPGDPIDPSVPAEDSFLELLAETLDNLDRGARGQFLQRFFKTIAQMDLTEALSLGLLGANPASAPGTGRKLG